MKFEYINIDNKTDEIPELELYFSSNETQLLHYYEPELGLFAVESPMVIERALMAGYEPRSFVMIDSVADEMCRKFSDMIKGNQIPVYVGSYETIADLTGVNITRGVLSIMKRRSLPSLPELVKDCRRIAVFDNVENPTNIGAMFRSAAALGIEAVVVAGTSSDPLYRRASRVSVGTVFQVPWTKIQRNKSGNNKLENEKNSISGETSYIKELQALGFKTAAMALSENSVSISDESLKREEKLAIILGNEGFGLSDEVIEDSDYVVKIPMKNNVDSLNVAAASSVVFWELMK